MSKLPVVGVGMSALRQRPFITGNGVSKNKTDTNSRNCATDHIPPGSGGRWYTSIRFIWFLVIFFALVMLYPRQVEFHRDLYAVCSRDGAWIYTVDEMNTMAECIVVSGSYIIHTGSRASVARQWGSALEVAGADATGDDRRFGLMIHDIPTGSIIVPGLSDSHSHILEYGASSLIQLEAAKNIDEAVASVRKYILSEPEIRHDMSKFVEGWGWDHTSWPVQEWPTAANLDADPVIRGRPVVLHAKDGHGIWVSQKVLESSMPFPDAVEGGIIVRDIAGNPTGVFIDNAQDLITKPVATDHDLMKLFNRTMQDAMSLGLTSLHDAGLDPTSLDFFKRLADKDNIPLRIYGMRYFDENEPYWGNQTKPIIARGNAKLTTRSVKMFADGALRTGGAALHEPYHDNPGTTGVMRLSAEVLHAVISRFLSDGWQVNVHAIGDRANGIVLDAFEAALKDVDVASLRPRLEHAQLMTKKDMERLGRLGVIASIQPTHATSDMLYAESRLGPERVKRLYAFRSLIDSGAKITLGSDFPVEGMNPLAGFYAAITRLSNDGDSPHGPSGWFPEQCLTREEALRGMTIDPAYASFTESTLGSLERGKRADFVILSRDIMSVPAHEILDTKVLATFLDGSPIFGHL